ncbi:DUF429 domain-containing protein [Chloroflexota bacterium]
MRKASYIARFPQLFASLLNVKKTPNGFHERIKVLRRVCNQTDAVIQIAKSEFQGKIADDDILDALVARVTALVGERKVLTLPEKPEIDVRGLPMEMIYYRIKPEQEGENGELLPFSFLDIKPSFNAIAFNISKVLHNSFHMAQVG